MACFLACCSEANAPAGSPCSAGRLPEDRSGLDGLAGMMDTVHHMSLLLTIFYML